MCKRMHVCGFITCLVDYSCAVHNMKINFLVLPQQYIFGEFSPDEFNQFFVTPRCFVEVSMETSFSQIFLSVYLHRVQKKEVESTRRYDLPTVFDF